MSVQFSCNGCGRCCKGHHIPLTLSEAKSWAKDGGQILVLVEGFMEDGTGLPLIQREHATKRSVMVETGDRHLNVSITFAAFNDGSCRNLLENNQCGIYETRPLVCRIYPIEINPHIPLDIENKSCDAHTWESGPELMRDGQISDEELKGLVEASRLADRNDITQKLFMCNLLSINTAALKGNGFTAYLPDMSLFMVAMDMATDPYEQEVLENLGDSWNLHVSDHKITHQMQLDGANVVTEASDAYVFIPMS